MPKKTLRRFIPSREQVQATPGLGLLGEWVYAPNLWHVNRYSTSMAMFVGLFLAFIPIPGQMLLAALMAVVLRCNLPLSVALVWLTNPVTMPAIFYVAYQVGALLLDMPVQAWEFELSFSWLGSQLSAMGKPLMVGCLVCGLFCGSVGYFVMNQIWRWRVAWQWRARQRLRAERKLSGPG